VIADWQRFAINDAEHGPVPTIVHARLPTVGDIELREVERTLGESNLVDLGLVDLIARRRASISLWIEGERVTPLMRVEAGWGVRGDDVAVSFVGHTQGLKRRSAVHRLPRIVERRNTAAVRAGAAGIAIFSVALAVLTVCWPSSRWLGNFTDLASPRDLVSVALANSIVLVAAYLAIAALVWAFADATMPRPRDFGVFTASAPADRAWRIAHLSDIHVVGERYGFRIEKVVGRVRAEMSA